MSANLINNIGNSYDTLQNLISERREKEKKTIQQAKTARIAPQTTLYSHAIRQEQNKKRNST